MLLTSTTDFKHSHDEATVLKWDQACWISLQMWTVFAEPHWINLMSSYSCTQWLKYRLFELAIGPKGFFTDVSLLKLQIFLLKPKNDVTNFVDVCCSTVLSAQDGWVGTCRTWRHPAFRVPGKVILHISVTSGGSVICLGGRGEGAVQLLTYFGQFSLKTAWKCRNLDRSRIPGTSAWIRHFYRPQRSCGQGNVFTGVCLSTGWGCLPQCMLGCHTPLDGHPPPGWRTPPGWRPPWMENPPRMENHPLDGDPPGWRTPPPGKQTPAYGLRAAGTHPTGMHSCLRCVNVFETSKDANPNMTSLTRNKFKFPVQPSKKLVQRWKLMGRKLFGVCFGTLTLLIDITCH